MSIRTYFENIADAIKNVYGTTDTLTPAEMPEAITNFNSIFQTKNLSTPISGQTTVEGCLSSLSSDLSELGNITLLGQSSAQTSTQGSFESVSLSDSMTNYRKILFFIGVDGAVDLTGVYPTEISVGFFQLFNKSAGSYFTIGANPYLANITYNDSTHINVKQIRYSGGDAPIRVMIYGVK